MSRLTFNLEDELDIYLIRGKEITPFINEVSSYTNDSLTVDYNEDMLDCFGRIEIDDKYVKAVKRYKTIVNKLKQEFGYRCQLCSFSFDMDNGEKYCEAHHIVQVSEHGSQGPENVIILCPNHHRLFHYSKGMISIGQIIGGKREIYIGDTKHLVSVSELISDGRKEEL